MKFSIDKQENHLIFTLHEEKLDSTLAPNLKSEFITLNAEGFANIVLDLSETKYIDSSGLSSILVANRLSTTGEGELVLAGVNDHVMKLFKISQLDSVISMEDTVSKAVATLTKNELKNN